MIISDPVQTAVCRSRPIGASVVLVVAQLSVVGSYLPPLLKKLPAPFHPPQMIISLPVHTALCRDRGDGALMVLVEIQLSVAGLYLRPVFDTPPPQTIISLPVQIPVGLLPLSGGLAGIQLSVLGSYLPPVPK